MVGMLEYLMMRQQQAQDKQNQQTLMASMFTGTPAQPQQAMMPSPQGPMPDGGVSPPMQGQGGLMPGSKPNPLNPSNLSPENQYAQGSAIAPLMQGPQANQLKALLSGLSPSAALPLLSSLLQNRIIPKSPIDVANDHNLVAQGPNGDFKTVYTSPTKKPTFAEAPHSGINPKTGKLDQFIIGNDGSQQWLNTPPGPKVNFVNGQAVDENAVMPGTVIPQQEPKQNYNQPFNNDGTPNKAYQDYKLKEVGAEAAARQAAANGTGLGADGNAIGITGNPKIDATTPGYTSAIVKGTNMTQGAIDLKALDHITGGTEPPQGRTGVAGIQNAAISNRMAEMDPGGNLAKNKTQVRSFSQSLAQQQKYLDSTQRALNTANDTLDALQEWMTKNNVNPRQFPDFNTFSNFLKARGIDPGIAGGYNAQLTTLRAEFSQVLSKGGVRSVETDREAAKLIPDGLAPAQLAQVAERIRVDGMNVTRDAQNQVAKVTGQIDKIRDGNASASYEPPPTGHAATTSKIDDIMNKYPPRPK